MTGLLLAACKRAPAENPEAGTPATPPSSVASTVPSTTADDAALGVTAEKAAVAAPAYNGVPRGNFGELDDKLHAAPRVVLRLAQASTTPQVVVSALSLVPDFELRDKLPTIDANKVVLTRLSDPVPAIRGTALEMASFVGPRVGFPAHDAELRAALVASCTKETHATLRATACATLAYRAREEADRTAEVETALTAALADASAFVVGRTLGSISAWCSPKLVERYLGAAKHPEPIVRGYAASNLGRCLSTHREKATVALDALLADPNPLVRADAAFTVGLREVWASIDRVVPLLDDERVATTTPLPFTEIRLDGEGPASWAIGSDRTVAAQAMEGLLHAGVSATPAFVASDDKDLGKSKREFVAWWKKNGPAIRAKAP